ncbi:uncharacterized protein PAC_01031 [Phialocephala subalpina]|uniref:NACHT domain-containing protein n=1 Tax=Phialocephala subalpina TaxID=576137 RepID=A0A1L7WEG5_9HELO|nr:uncharacterized protein PAC_01031 [Phialocephala subalpina]
METNAPNTAFQKAFIEWRDSLFKKKKSHKYNFLLSCNYAILTEHNAATAESVEEAVRMIEVKNSQKTSTRMIKKIIGPVVKILKDYEGIIEILCQADPFPSAIIWGCLKVIVNGLGRYFELFEKIRGQLDLLKFQLERLKWCDELWGDSDDMQRYLCNTYVHVFRFWSAIDKECNRISLNTIMRAATSFSTKKIQSIIDDLGEEVDKIDKLWPIVEGRKARGERQDSEKERQEAGLERMESRLERQVNADFREKVLEEHDTAQRERYYSEMSQWLQRRAENGSSIKLHGDNLDNRCGNTCDWLVTAPWYDNWAKDVHAQPILWLYAQPGSGKSTLCSHAISHVVSLPDSPVAAFQFFRFDEQTTARQLSYNLATQLFEEYWRRNRTVPENLRVNTAEAADNFKNIQTLIRSLLPELPKVFLFLDGLDEEDSGARQKEATKIIGFVLELARSFPDKVRVWFSTQDRPLFRKWLGEYAVDIQEHIKSSVHLYLCKELPGICDIEMDEATHNWALKELQDRADGHFLWATLMIKEITLSIPSLRKLKHFIKTGLPSDLDGYYKRILGKYKSDTEREYAAKILSLVVFARRRLTVNEIIEAVWITSDEAGQKDDMMFLNFTKKIFAPLVVIDHDPTHAGNDYCRLFHSTVKSFLLQHQDILLDGTGECDDKHIISERIIGRACLSYLRLDKYATLLRNTSTETKESWTTSSGEDIATHHLLRYSSKYWDKHLDDAKESPMLRTSVEEFLKSPNFVTTLQLQSLFVESHFGIYILRSVGDQYKWLKRVFPRWFTKTKGASGPVFEREYRAFVSEWRWFLHKPTCSSHCRNTAHAGEVDRILWGTLGPQSFLSRSPGRYESFMVANDAAPKKRLSKAKARICIDAFGLDGKEVAIVHFASKPRAQSTFLEFNVETWGIRSGSTPTLKSQQCISTDRDECHWEHYTQASVGRKTLIPVKFSPDLSFLRLGSQVFAKDGDGAYVQRPTVGEKKTNNGIPWYFEDFTSRGQYVALVSRQKPPNLLPAPNSALEEKKEGKAQTEDENSDESGLSTASSSRSIKDEKTEKKTPDSASEDSDPESRVASEAESEIHQIDTESSSESIELDSGDEDWSEGSTDLENGLGISSDQNGDTTSSSVSSSAAETESHSDSDSDSDAERPAPEFAPFDDSDDGRVQFYSDSEDGRRGGGGSSDDEGPIRRYFSKSNVQKGMITILDFSEREPRVCWQYRHPLPIMLYGSTPAFHPTKGLAVWPLYGGDILFVDFEQKTHFIRKARVTTRHVFIKPQFSADGAHLHLASLEAQTLPKPKRSKSEDKKETSKEDRKPLLRTSLFITTHRLSASKTTRAPPTLVHRVKIFLGVFESISASQMPFSLTWTKEFLYVVCSSMKLRMFRIALFPHTSLLSHPERDADDRNRKEEMVMVSKNEIFLPDSARVRSVQYFPPDEETPSIARKGTILIGSLNSIKDRRIKEMWVYDTDTAHLDELPDVTSPPIGLFVTEEDLGGWITEEGRIAELEKGRGRGGGLERKIEKFDAEDDCDIEPYLN